MVCALFILLLAYKVTTRHSQLNLLVDYSLLSSVHFISMLYVFINKMKLDSIGRTIFPPFGVSLKLVVML